MQKNVNCPFHLWWSTTKMESFAEITYCIQCQIELQNNLRKNVKFKQGLPIQKQQKWHFSQIEIMLKASSCIVCTFNFEESCNEQEVLSHFSGGPTDSTKHVNRVLQQGAHHIFLEDLELNLFMDDIRKLFHHAFKVSL